MEEWLPPLQEGHADQAWDRFLVRYRALLFATIRHFTRDHDDRMDLFAHVCERLRADDMARLRARAEDSGQAARFSTWLVVVIRNLVIDWYRHRDGRARLGAAARALPPLQREILELVALDGHSHMEAFGRLEARHPGLSFSGFLRELRVALRHVGEPRHGRLLRNLAPLPDNLPAPETEPPVMEVEERSSRLAEALEGLPPGDRAVISLYVMEGLPAERVAEMLQLPSAKAVYNRAYRALSALRRALSARGLEHGDL